MSTNISASEKPIQRIFSDDYTFSIPLYQRPYAWTHEEAGELLDDLLMFMGDMPGDVSSLDPYFLGSIVLIKGDHSPRAEVVDGQQRLTTLTILLAVLRAILPAQYKQPLTKFLYDEGDPIAGTANNFRLTLRERDAVFFQDHIQIDGGIQALNGLNSAVLPDSHQRIRDNALLFFQKLTALPETKCLRLAQFISQRCFLVVVSTPDFSSAYRIFSVLNDRGMQLLYTDILKADVIGKLPSSAQDNYTKKWEEHEERLGRDAFQNLFAYIRMIKRKVKPQETILEEFRKYLKPSDQPQHFIDTLLIPYANAFYEIKNLDYQSTQNADEINQLFNWLNRIDNVDWLPPAILFLARNHNDPTKLLWFFSKLERLAAGMMILRKNVNQRIQQYGPLLTAIENGDDLSLPSSPLDLDAMAKQGILQRIEGNLYEEPTVRYILLRLDATLAANAGMLNMATISVEHVLPQNPKQGSEWLIWFPDQDERSKWVHRLANLVLLTRTKNSQAQNFDFGLKKTLYFNKPVATSSALTIQVLKHTNWTPALLEQRQIDLLNELKQMWNL